MDFFDVKGLVEQVCAMLGVAVRTEPIVAPFLVPGQSAAVIVADGPGRGARVGLTGQLSPAIADARGLPRQDRVMVAELNLDHLSKARTAASDAIVPLARHPFVVRDLSIVVVDVLPAEIIRDTIQASGRDLPAPLAVGGIFRSLSRQGRGGRRRQYLGAADLPGGRSHADRRSRCSRASTGFSPRSFASTGRYRDRNLVVWLSGHWVIDDEIEMTR